MKSTFYIELPLLFKQKKFFHKIPKHERKQCLKECLFEIFGSIENNFVPRSFAPLASLGVKNAV
jgi:hypothetical protein